jgi:DNA-binding response OmpR family regulator
MMPKLRGDELCRRIKADAALSRTPVVMLSAVSAEDVPDQCADVYLTKPFDLPEIEAVFHRFVRS